MTKPKPPATTPKSRSLRVPDVPNTSKDARMANLATAASLPSAMVIADYSKGTLGEISLADVLDSLKDHASSIKGGDLTRVETMLGGQAAALNTMFSELARRAALNMGQYRDTAEVYLKLALRAQSQCRATLETLATIKNPPIFAKQANIAHGPQQVNNEAAGIARAEQIENKPNELLEQDHGQRLDTGTKAAASGSHQAMATVEAVRRPANARRKSSGKP